MIILRGHHLFCTTLFSGNGYDKNFVENMKYIISKLEDEEIKIIKSHDDICKSCPNLTEDGFCRNGMDNVVIRDKNALDVLNIKENGVYTYKYLRNKLKTLSETQFNMVCHHCQWGVDGFCNYDKFREKLI